MLQASILPTVNGRVRHDLYVMDEVHSAVDRVLGLLDAEGIDTGAGDLVVFELKPLVL